MAIPHKSPSNIYSEYLAPDIMMFSSAVNLTLNYIFAPIATFDYDLFYPPSLNKIKHSHTTAFLCSLCRTSLYYILHPQLSFPVQSQGNS